MQLPREVAAEQVRRPVGQDDALVEDGHVGVPLVSREDGAQLQRDLADWWVEEMRTVASGRCW